jgi:hypothetical protein
MPGLHSIPRGKKLTTQAEGVSSPPMIKNIRNYITGRSGFIDIKFEFEVDTLFCRDL